MTPTQFLDAIRAAYPYRPVSRKTVYNWLHGKTKMPEWALKLKGTK